MAWPPKIPGSRLFNLSGARLAFAPSATAGRKLAPLGFAANTVPGDPRSSYIIVGVFVFSPLRFCSLVLAVSCCADAAVTLPGILTEHMVLQRGLPIHIWGKASPDEVVSVVFRGETQSTKADVFGAWSVHLSAADAGGPFELTVTGTNTISFRDILVGDVWVASGQSNMEFKLRQADDAAAEIAAAQYPRIRRIVVNRKVADYPMDDAPVQPWTETTPDSAPNASAVAYFFARELHSKLGGVPIGVIESFWGGTPVEAWMSLRSISQDPALMPIFSEWSRSLAAYPTALARYEQRLAAWKEGTPKPAKPETGPGGSQMPAGLYNAMIAPITPYPIKGAIWYQGETNANPTRFPIYSRAFQSMIGDWRQAWGEGDFPFLFVQLPNYKTNGYWPDLREQQRQTLALRNTAMAVTIDVGIPDNLHPPHKREVGLRLALLARALVYGEKIEYSGPVFLHAERQSAALRLWFDHASGLAAKDGAPRGFEIAGPDRKFVAAEARVEGSTVVAWSSSVAAPAFVRYAWADSPECNLYNGAGLPAGPFRSAE